MAESHDTITRFVTRVGRRLGWRTLWAVGTGVVCVAAGAVGLAAAARVAFGYAAEPWWFVAAAAAAVVGTVAGWWLRRPGREDAAAFADGQFGLRDALISWTHFRRDGREGGFYDLQARKTADSVASLDASSVGVAPGRGRWLTAVVAVAFAAVLGFMEPSAAVQERIALDEFTTAETARINGELQDRIDELVESLDGDEQELIDENELRERVDAFEQTADQKQALRQYARLENVLQEQLARLGQKQDERLASRAAEELAEAPEARELAETLKKMDYKASAEQLAAMKPAGEAKLSEQQKEAARLRAASRRMAAAARGRESSPGGRESSAGRESDGSGSSSSASGGSQGSPSGAAGGAGGGEGGDLGDALTEFDAATAALEEALRESERNPGDKQCESNCEVCRSRVSDSLDSLSAYLKRMALKRNLAKRLSSLCKACSQCQAGLCQGRAQCQGQQLAQSPKAGGQKAGAGSVDSRREGTDPLAVGPTEQLAGIKGDGPSMSTVESADSGSGVASRGGGERERSFRRGVESYVSREDVPADVRRGVKNYFELIHDIAPTAAENAAP